MENIQTFKISKSVHSFDVFICTYEINACFMVLSSTPHQTTPQIILSVSNHVKES